MFVNFDPFVCNWIPVTDNPQLFHFLHMHMSVGSVSSDSMRAMRHDELRGNCYACLKINSHLVTIRSVFSSNYKIIV